MLVPIEDAASICICGRAEGKGSVVSMLTTHLMRETKTDTSEGHSGGRTSDHIPPTSRCQATILNPYVRVAGRAGRIATGKQLSAGNRAEYVSHQ
jgi:hypothetical protein